MLHEAIQRLAHALRGSIASSAIISDSLSKGQFREDDLLNGLRPLIPERYALSKGIVLTLAGAQSAPQDIILSDRMMVGELLSNPTVRLHPIESTVGTIQVKTRADADSVRSAVENVATVKRLMPSTPRIGHMPYLDGGASKYRDEGTPFGGLLFLTQAAKTETITTAYNDACAALPKRERPNGLVILDSFALLWGAIKDGGVQWALGPNTNDPSEVVLLEADDKTIPLLYFYTILVESLRCHISPPLDYLEYTRCAGHKFLARGLG